MTADRELSLAHHFADLTDPRIDRSRLHELLDIVAIAICAVVAGADSWDDIEDFGNAKIAWLGTFLDLPNGIPSHDTFRRLFERLDPDEFQRGFLGWIEALQEATERQVIAIDGRTLRRSFDRAKGKSALHLVHAWATANHLLLGQVAVDQKSNEITAIPVLLKMLSISGAIVTIDAMGCQKEIARTIRGREADLHPGIEGQPRAPLRTGRGVLGPGVRPADEGSGYRLRPTVVRGPWPDRGPAVLGHLGPGLAGGPGGVEGPEERGVHRERAIHRRVAERGDEVLPEQPAERRQVAQRCGPEPLGSGELAALGPGCDVPGGPEPDQEGERPGELRAAASAGVVPAEEGVLNEAEHQGEAVESLMGRGVSPAGFVRKCRKLGAFALREACSCT